MKYSITSIEAKPGEDIKVILTNIGTQPKEVMGHDWVLLKAGSDVAAFDAAALNSKDTGYIPAALSDEIIAHIDLLGPRKSGEVEFTGAHDAGRLQLPVHVPGPLPGGDEGRAHGQVTAAACPGARAEGAPVGSECLCRPGAAAAASGDTMSWENESHFVSTDPGLLDLDFVCAALAGSYWAQDRPRA